MQAPVFVAAARAMSAQAAPQTPPQAKGSMLNDVTIGRVMREKVCPMVLATCPGAVNWASLVTGQVSTCDLSHRELCAREFVRMARAAAMAS